MNFLRKTCQQILVDYFFFNYNIDIQDMYPYFFDDNLPLSPSKEHNTNWAEISKRIDNLSLKKITNEEKRQNGIYFTCDDSLIDRILSPIHISVENKFRVLEPSAGIGNFTIALIRKIKKENTNAPSNAVFDLVANNLVSVEINTCFCIALEAKILLECAEIIADIYKKDNTCKLPKLSVYNCDFLKFPLYYSMKYDYVVGNPPYVTMYGRRSINMNEEKRMFFNTFNFVSNKKGNNKFNLSMFFIENGIKLLKETGELIYLLDIAFFETAYKDIRKYILETTKIRKIEVLDTNFFNVTSGQLIIDIEKSNDFISNQENTIEWYEGPSSNTFKQFALYNHKNEYRFTKPFNNLEKIFVDHINQFEDLSSICPKKALRTCCALTGKTEEFIVDSSYCGNSQSVPFLEGAVGVPDKYCRPNAHKNIALDYELQLSLSNQFKKELTAKGVKNKKRVTLGDIDAYYYPKIFIRQSSKEIVCTYTEEPFAANNSLYILTFKDNTEKSKKLLKYLLGILNSDIISIYAQTTNIIRTGKGKTPQIKLSDLSRIPISISETHFDKIVELVDSILSSNDIGERKSLKQELDDLVLDIYSMDSSLFNDIKKVRAIS